MRRRKRATEGAENERSASDARVVTSRQGVTETWISLTSLMQPASMALAVSPQQSQPESSTAHVDTVAVFHHAGPYDAVIASRNKAASGRAPMAAFAKDSANMSIGGSGPLLARADHSTFMGNGTDEAFTDYATSISGAPPTKKDLALFDPHRRASVIHGDETVGLGTSTFLEGTPAARAAVQKAELESAQQNQDGGLQRKKSLAQRIRGINRPPRGEFGPSGRLTNPDAVYRDHSTSASMSSARNETNPFFAEYEPSKDGEEQITVRKMSQAGPGSPASPPLPGTLERRSTTDALSGPEQQPKKSGGGLLTRMKSLKGGPRSRPSDRDAGNAA